jgi:hypothetical protein
MEPWGWEGGVLHLNRTLIVDAVPEGPLNVLLGTSVLLYEIKHEPETLMQVP